jgi:DegV family protein with EDD domain
MKKKKYGILIDTGGGNNLKDYENTNIRVIPLHIIFEDGTDITDTITNLNKAHFYDRVKEGENVRTSQASPGELMEMYKEMLEEFEHIIHIPIAKNLSSMYQTATVVSLEFPEKISVIEHYMAANGLKELALELNRQLEINPKITLDEIYRFLKDYEKNMYLGLIPGDLRKFDKGGRGSSTLKSMLNLLKIKVLIR